MWLPDPERPRRIVRLAATKTGVTSVKQWLIADERGGWETSAEAALTRTEDEARKRGLMESQVDEEIAGYLCYLACQAMLVDKMAETANKKPTRGG